MIRLDNSSKVLMLNLDVPVTTTALDITVCYSDKTSTQYNGGTYLSIADGLADTVMCTSPDSLSAGVTGIVRDIDTISVVNTDSVSAFVTIYLDNAGSHYSIITVGLSVGDHLEYIHGNGWKVVDSSGNTKTTSTSGSVTAFPLTKTDDTNVTLTFGGSPLVSLLASVSMTLGWTGVLSFLRGGTGLSAIGTALQQLRVNATATALEYFTPTAAGVTSVATSTGLTGGTITTTGTLSLNTKLAPADTLTGNSLKFLRVNAGETAVEYATVSSGSVTSVATGTGLTGGTITSTGTVAFATDLQPIASLTGNALKVLRVNAGETAVEYATPSATGVTSVATAGLISGGTITATGTVTTSMATNKLVGRSTAGTGVMEEITVGAGLSLSGGTLDNSITKTSQLINDGDDTVSHFITLNDLPSSLSLYATNVASGISTYTKLVSSITDASYNTVAVDISTGAITTTAQFIAGLVTSPNLIVGDPGIFNITTIGNIRRTSGTGNATFYFEVYKRTVGGVETLITTSSVTLPVANGTYSEFNASGLWNDGLFLSTDRIVLKYYANRVAGGSNPTYDFQFGGVTPVRTLVPIPLTVVPVPFGTTAGTITEGNDTRFVNSRLTCGFDGGGGVVALNTNTVIPAMSNGATITNWYIEGDVSGSIVIDIKKNGTSMVGAGNKPTLSSATTANAAVSGWTSTTYVANDRIEVIVTTGATSITKCWLVFKQTITS